jgi:hypothetical protein
VDVLQFYHNRGGAGPSFSTRIRPSHKLVEHFNKLTVARDSRPLGLFHEQVAQLHPCLAPLS